MTLGEKLLSIPKGWLYLILILATSVPLFFKVQLPNKPKPEAESMFRALSELGPENTVIIQSDWTESTRGESRGMMDALLRTLMRQRVKIAMLSVGDPQAPEVAKNVLNVVNRELPEDQRYKKWDDWVELGLFPNAEALGQALKTNIRDAFAQKRDAPEGGQLQSVFQSPVLKDIKSISDVDLYVVVTGSKTIIVALERISDKVKMAGMVTGVMGPETYNYYVSGQLVGMAAGLKGVYDMETLMVEKFTEPGLINMDKGTKYIFTLHVGIALLIAAVVIGNVGVFLTRKRGR